MSKNMKELLETAYEQHCMLESSLALERAAEDAQELLNGQPGNAYEEAQNGIYGILVEHHKKGTLREYLTKYALDARVEDGLETGMEDIWDRLVYGLAGCHQGILHPEGDDGAWSRELDQLMAILRTVLEVSGVGAKLPERE